MRYVLIAGGAVVEQGEFESIEGRFHPSLQWVASETAQIGDLWDGTQFASAAPNGKEVPARTPNAAARKVLLRNGITDQNVRAAIANSTLSDQDKAEALVDWEFQPYVRRASPLVAALGPLLGLDDSKIDDLFIAAGNT
jgi:hypothetical protein